MEGSYPYDNAPGGSNPTAGDIAEMDAPIGDFETEISNHCFIPTISSLAINTTNLFYNIKADPNILSKTPFDMIYYPINVNEEHVNISPNCVSWLKDELVPQHIVLDGINDSWDKGDVRASGSITLKPGFSTVPGAKFHAYISSPLPTCASSLRSSGYSDNNEIIERVSETTHTEEIKMTFRNAVSVFPNPNNGQFYIRTNQPHKPGVLEIRNIQGIKVSKVNYDSTQNEIFIDISNHPDGIYVVFVILDDKTQTIKIKSHENF
jgi:hypothetical protein